MIKGIGVSSGIGVGKILRIETLSLEYSKKQFTDTKTEKNRFYNAIEVFSENTEARADSMRESFGAKEAEILLGHISIVRDHFFIDEVNKLIDEGQCAETAFKTICDMFIQIFSDSEDDITRQRADDVRDIRSRILEILLGIDHVSLSQAFPETILCVKELTPSMIAEIKKENIFGILTETGSTNSHSAILARTLEIPAVMSVPNIMSLTENGKAVIIDGGNGEVILSPSDDELKEYRKKREKLLHERRELQKYRGKSTVSADGIKYKIVCNIGKPQDASKVLEFDGEGVGLFRTEFLFMDRSSAPTEDEQFEAYKQTALILKDKPLIIRTLDIGGDKSIPYLSLTKEDNPFMGLRAIRYCLKNFDLFKTQLRAILRASAFGNVSIMFPLITCVEEIRQGKALVEALKAELSADGIDFDKNIKVGIMAETAAAGAIADILAKESDFFSIGTNDLTGYTMAADRGNSDVSYLYSALQPSVLRMIKSIIVSAREQNIPVGMCGEAAADSLMIPLLISFGLTEFSVSAPNVLRVRKYISEWTKQKADQVAEAVMKLSTEREIREYLTKAILS